MIAFNRLLREHDKLISDVLSVHSPTRRTDMGDGFQATFDSATAAIDAACAIQWGVWERNESLPPAHRFEVRIVLSAGELVQRGGKLHGMALIEAARLEKTADAGEIRCTDVFAFSPPRRTRRCSSSPRTSRSRASVKPAGSGASIGGWFPRHLPELPLPGPLLTCSDDVFVGRAIGAPGLCATGSRPSAAGTGSSCCGARPASASRPSPAPLPRSCISSTRGSSTAVVTVILSRPSNRSPRPWRRSFGTPAPRASCSGAAMTASSRSWPGPEPVSVGSSPAADPETARYELFAAVADWLATISRDNGVLFVIDDLDLADDPTLELVRHILRAASTGNVCLLGTCRWTEHPLSAGGGSPLHDLLRLNDKVEDVPLRGLGGGEVEAVLASTSARRCPPARQRPPSCTSCARSPGGIRCS